MRIIDLVIAGIAITTTGSMAVAATGTAVIIGGRRATDAVGTAVAEPQASVLGA